MTTELVLLAGLAVFILGAFLGPHGPQTTFKLSGPRLGARIERNITTGAGFTYQAEGNAWQKPDGQSPNGQLP